MTGARRADVISQIFRVIAALFILSGCTLKPRVVGLVAVEPRPLIGEYAFLGPIYMERWKIDKVDSIQPVFRWEAFPNMKPSESGGEDIASQIKDVTYDLKVWEIGGERTGDLFVAPSKPWYFFGPGSEPIYSQTGLTEPVHQIAVRLKPSTLYVWTVRARFLLAGQPRVTDWGQSFVKSLHRGGDSAFSRDIDDDFYGYYMFVTPSGK